ncbi:hypothetical protein A9G35_05110 [Gilliamella sp. Choc5-1]|uniref:hypothetical protein n=1 Tax=Gilliamella sp. Choc5-1 TaxID=3120238 RepID=UPI00080E6F1B|nr:hypothetical protein [Gilliamella apicola]OCG46496.1 hypothetical protein A9G35_05110 [Gilliamella apicola]
MKKITIVLSVLILTACGDSSQVKQVKDYVYDNIDSTLTVGNALDNRNICNKTKWDSYKDERDRNIVEYTCEFKKDHPNQFLKLTFSGMAGNLKTMLVDKNINITLDGYEKFKEEEKRYKNVKYPHYTVYKNYIDAKAKSYIKAKAKLVIYDKLKKALLEIEKSNALARYQENRKYLLSNKEIIIKEIKEEEKYKILDSRGFYARYPDNVIKSIYGDKSNDGIINYDHFFLYGFSEGRTNTNIDNKDIVKKIEQIEKDIISIKEILKKHGLIFERGYASFKRYKGEKVELLDLYDDDYSKLIYQYLLEGNSAKKITLNTKDGKRTLSVNNYQELLVYFEGVENGIVKNIIEKVIDPYNQNLTNKINQFEKLAKDIKTESYQQKIKWVLIGERNPSLISCELEFKTDGYPSVKSDSSMSSSCFRNAYKTNYVDQIYNQPIMSFINKVAN